MAPRALSRQQRYDQAFRLALEVLQTEQDSEPADPKGDHEMVVAPEVWQLMVALARQAMTGKRGKPTWGICSGCGCTWLAACEGGCSWANKKLTLCSRCKGKGGRHA